MKKYRDILRYWYFLISHNIKSRLISSSFSLSAVEWWRSFRRMRTTAVICFEGRQVNIAPTGRSAESPPFFGRQKNMVGANPGFSLSHPVIIQQISFSFAIFLLPRLGNSCTPPVATGLINHWSVLNDHEPCKTRFFSTWHTRAPVIPVYHAWRRRGPPERNITRVIFTIISRLDVNKTASIRKKKKLKQWSYFFKQ